MMNRNNNQKAWEGKMNTTTILTTATLDAVFNYENECVGFIPDTSWATIVATKQAAGFNCKVNFVNESNYGGDFRIQYSGTKENLDRLLVELGYDFESSGMVWLVQGTTYEYL
jgi:hypothetical protein